jgi:hypothetical protein
VWLERTALHWGEDLWECRACVCIVSVCASVFMCFCMHRKHRCVYVLRHVYICAYACVVVAAKPRPAASSSSPPLREKGLFLDDSLQLWNTGKMCLHRTKQSPQKFFPVSDSRQLPALSSASHTCNLFVSQTLFISWCFSSHPFSFVCLSSWLVFVFAGSGSPASVCPSLCLGRVLPQSVTFLFSSWL